MISDAAWAREYRACRDNVLAFARNLTKDREAAEDLTQAAFAKAWEVRERFVPGTNFRGWVIVIAKHMFFDEQKMERYRSRTRADYSRTYEHVQFPNQETRISLAEALSRMETLKRRDRDVLVLAMMGVSGNDAAQATGVQRETASSRLSKARVKLRALLDEPSL